MGRLTGHLQDEPVQVGPEDRTRTDGLTPSGITSPKRSTTTLSLLPYAPLANKRLLHRHEGKLLLSPPLSSAGAMQHLWPVRVRGRPRDALRKPGPAAVSCPRIPIRRPC